MSRAAVFQRLGVLVIVMLLIGGAAFTYHVKHEAVEASKQVAALRAAIERERIRLSLLKAEWGELTQPGRLQDLVSRYPDVIALTPFGVDRMVPLRAIPYAPNHDFIAEMLAAAPAARGAIR
jgi:hypothetical protein